MALIPKEYQKIFCYMIPPQRVILKMDGVVTYDSHPCYELLKCPICGGGWAKHENKW